MYKLTLQCASLTIHLMSSSLAGMETCRTLWTEAVCMNSSSVYIRSLGLWRRSGSAVVRWSAWALCTSYSNTSTRTTQVSAPARRSSNLMPDARIWCHYQPFLRCCKQNSFFLFALLSWLLWDDAEVVARLPVRDGRRGQRDHRKEKGVRECHQQHAEEQPPSHAQGLYHWWSTEVLNIYKYMFCNHLLFPSWWRSSSGSGSRSQRLSTPRCVPTCWVCPWRPSLSWLWASASKTTLMSFPSTRTMTRWESLL